MFMSLFMMVCSANAQIKDDIQKSKERAGQNCKRCVMITKHQEMQM